MCLRIPDGSRPQQSQKAQKYLLCPCLCMTVNCSNTMARATHSRIDDQRHISDPTAARSGTQRGITLPGVL